MNRVIGPYSAIVDGKWTGLAGCKAAAGCDMAHLCLRSSPELACKEDMPMDGKRCRGFIPLEAA